MAKYCTQCGAKLDDDDLFCGVCGVSLSSPKQENEPVNKEQNKGQSYDEPQYEPVASQATPKTTKKIPSWVAIAAGVVACILLLICVLPKDSGDSKDGNSYTPQIGNSSSHQKTLSDSEVQSIAKQLNEQINFFGDTSKAYNLQYSNFKIESDDFNRYIVCMHYQYEDANRKYHSADVIVYFRYIPETDKYEYKRTNIKFPMRTLTEEYLVNSIKEDVEFGWGTDPDKPTVEQPATDTGNSDNTTSTNNQNVTVNNTWGDAFKNVLADTVKDYPQHQYSCNYSVFDIDKDGTPELFVKVGTCEADYEFKVYSYSKSKNQAECFSTFGGGHSVLCGLGNEKAFLINYGHQGYEQIIKCTYNNGKIEQETIFEALVENYHDFTFLPYYELNDYSGLDWKSNPSDNNQSVLDNYSLDDNIVPAPEITTENFEEKVKLEKRADWYDNGIFSGYINETFGGSYSGSYEYMGTNYTDFKVSEYGWTTFDVYKKVDSDGWTSYLFVPYTEELGNLPTVYLFMDGWEEPAHIWSGA